MTPSSSSSNPEFPIRQSSIVNHQSSTPLPSPEKTHTAGPARADGAPPKLLDRMRNELRVRHYAIRTEHTYIDWVRDFIFFHGKRHPAEMGAAEINAWLTHLACERNVAASTQSQALCGVLFL